MSLGPYRITGVVGAGAMGEVYLARDTHLNRDVALKVLPESLAVDPDRLARLKREAQIVASLNRQNIAAIYRFEDGDGIEALVLEFVDGPTLAQRIAHGPIPLDQALRIDGVAQSSRSYDLSLDGTRFLMVKRVDGTAARSMVLEQKWAAELRRLVPKQ